MILDNLDFRADKIKGMAPLTVTFFAMFDGLGNNWQDDTDSVTLLQDNTDSTTIYQCE